MNLSELLNLPEIDRNVDIVFVIDAAKTMKPIIDKLQQVDSLYDKLLEVCSMQGKSLNFIRFKVIWYRDFFADGDNTYGESSFFEMPRERENFKEYLEGIYAYGGNNTRRLGLAALSMALNSDFVQEGDKKRHIVIQFTDAPSYSFEEIHDLITGYDINNNMLLKKLNGMPGSFDEFSDNYHDGIFAKLDKNGKRLLLITPNVYPWSDMACEFEYTLQLDLNNATDFDLECLYGVFSYPVI